MCWTGLLCNSSSIQVNPSRKDPLQEPIRRPNPSRRRAANQPDRADPQWVKTPVCVLLQPPPPRKIFCRPLYPFFLLLIRSSFLSLPSSLCPSILQSYKKAIDEVSYTRAPTLPATLSHLFIYFWLYPSFLFASTLFRAPLFVPRHDGLTQRGWLLFLWNPDILSFAVQRRGACMCASTNSDK